MLQSIHVKPAGVKSMAGQTIGSLELERADLDEHAYVLRGQLAGSRADRLFDHIAQTARWQQEYINCCGRKAQPRLTTWFGLGFSAESRYRDPLDAQPWTPELVTLRDELGQVVNTSFNAPREPLPVRTGLRLLAQRRRAPSRRRPAHRAGVARHNAAVLSPPKSRWAEGRLRAEARRCARHGRTLPERVGTHADQDHARRGEVQPHPPMLRTPVKVACSAPGR